MISLVIIYYPPHVFSIIYFSKKREHEYVSKVDCSAREPTPGLSAIFEPPAAILKFASGMALQAVGELAWQRWAGI